MGTHQVVYLDDLAVRQRARSNPRFFLDELPARIILDEAPLAPELFSEIKRRVDEARLVGQAPPDIWITGSNQTLLQSEVRESLAGRASYFDLNTLSAHELQSRFKIGDFLFRGGWPELYASEHLDPLRYLNDLISTFIERDIVAAAGIERLEAFTKCLQLTAARVGQLMNFSDIARSSGVESPTIQSWLTILERNGVIRRLEPFFTNLNKRLIRAPKFYFEDVALGTRLQGWTELQPLLVSPNAGALLENIVVTEVARFFTNRGENPQLNFLRSKEGVEIDLLVNLPNQRTIAIEVKSAPRPLTQEQHRLLDQSQLPIIARWVVAPTPSPDSPGCRHILIGALADELQKLIG
jgi:predicted AAA+ superfamily ATPase